MCFKIIKNAFFERKTECNLVKKILLILSVCLLIFVFLACNISVVNKGDVNQTDEPSSSQSLDITTVVYEESDNAEIPEESEKVPETTQEVIPETEPPENSITEIVLDIPTVIHDSIVSSMTNYPNLQTLKVDNIVFTPEEYIAVCQMNPEVDFFAKVEFENITFDLSQKEIDISKKKIKDKEAFSALVEQFPKGTKLVMCDCNYTNEEMASLREKYSHIDFAWRIYMGKWNLRTDDEAFSVMIHEYDHKPMRSKEIEVLKYCTNMVALDLGHQAITDLTVIGQMTDLKVLILADNWITDLTPLSNLKNLEYLELFVNNISDLSPLAECTKLVDLNFGWNKVSDFSCIYSLENIERLWLPNTPLPVAKRDEVIENFPNAKIVFSDVNSVSSGWRTHERYFSMRGMFKNNKYDPDFIKK